jgi:aminoglycoside phosphotransferase (APT) family kinase protein/SAM-dependent methyltransferase
VLAPSFAVNGAPKAFYGERMRELLADASASGWEDARRRFTTEVLAGRLRAPKRSRLARLRAKLAGTTWEDTLQDLVDPTRAGWKFLLDLRPESRVLFLGPTWGAAPLALAAGCAQVVVLDGALERLQLTRHQAWAAGFTNLTFARVVDPLQLPLADATVDVVVVPGLAEWLTSVAGGRPLPEGSGAQLLRELRRVLGPDGQAYIGTDTPVTRLLGGRRPKGSLYSARAMRADANAAGFAGCRLFAPLPFRHKFHQVLDLDHTDRMNFSADAYRTRGRLVRPLIRLWDRCNRGAAIERRLYGYLPGMSAVLSGNAGSRSFAERIIQHVTPGRDSMPLTRYFVRPKGVAVLVAGRPEQGPHEGLVVRLPLDPRAEDTCALHHRTLESFASDARLSPALRALFPAPIAQGTFEGQTFFAETSLHGESGRLYYSRSDRRYDRAIVNAAEVLCGLRRATETPVVIDQAEFDRLVGTWLGELRGLVREENRATIDAIAGWLAPTLIGSTLPLGWHHGDYDFANLLYGADDSVTGILDFEVFEPRGLPLIDLLLLLARRPIRKQGFAFGTLFTNVILNRNLPRLEAGLLEEEMRILGIDEPLYRALALCCWLNHLRLRRDTWLVRSPSWLDDNLHDVVECVRRLL